MKNKITCLLAGAALFGATANAEIVLTDDLSAYGYIDMALTDGEGDANTETAVAEFELGLSFTPAESKWSAVVELSFDRTIRFDEAAALQLHGFVPTRWQCIPTQSDTEFETVTISYQYSDTLSFTFGNIETYQGFETFDATGLYQFSYAGAGGTLHCIPLDTQSVHLLTVPLVTSIMEYGSVTPIQGTNSFEYYLGYNGVENLSLNFVIR